MKLKSKIVSMAMGALIATSSSIIPMAVNAVEETDNKYAYNLVLRRNSSI